jgi:hypothetical protein
MSLPVLDPRPSTVRPSDWSFNKIMEAKAILPAYPESWKNSNVSIIAPRDQDFRGTCVGQSSAEIADLLHIENVPADNPTPADREQYQKDVTDSIGTIHDILYPQSFSAESLYQMSRYIGNVTYPSGSEIRFAAKAGISYGMNTEIQWHTDKKGTKVWTYPPGLDAERQKANGGCTQTDAATFASLHKWEGWALIGDGMNLYWEEICSAIYQKHCVLGGIPVYENYTEMQGGDGTFPDPKGNIVGYHALAFYGYDNDFLYLIHSWGSWCGRLGKISRNYFNKSVDQSVYIVILDESDVAIARQIYGSMTITSNVPAIITVNSLIAGSTPLKISTEPGKSYMITASAVGYIAQTKQADDSVTVVDFTLEPFPQPEKTWWQKFLDWIFSLFGR